MNWVCGFRRSWSHGDPLVNCVLCRGSGGWGRGRVGLLFLMVSVGLRSKGNPLASFFRECAGGEAALLQASADGVRTGPNCPTVPGSFLFSCSGFSGSFTGSFWLIHSQLQAGCLECTQQVVSSLPSVSLPLVFTVLPPVGCLTPIILSLILGQFGPGGKPCELSNYILDIIAHNGHLKPLLNKLVLGVAWCLGLVSLLRL